MNEITIMLECITKTSNELMKLHNSSDMIMTATKKRLIEETLAKIENDIIEASFYFTHETSDEEGDISTWTKICP